MEAKYQNAWVHFTSVGHDQNIWSAAPKTTQMPGPWVCPKNDEGANAEEPKKVPQSEKTGVWFQHRRYDSAYYQGLADQIIW